MQRSTSAERGERNVTFPNGAGVGAFRPKRELWPKAKSQLLQGGSESLGKALPQSQIATAQKLGRIAGESIATKPNRKCPKSWGESLGRAWPRRLTVLLRLGLCMPVRGLQRIHIDEARRLLQIATAQKAGANRWGEHCRQAKS